MIQSGRCSNYLFTHPQKIHSGVIHSIFEHSFNIKFQEVLLHIGDNQHSLSCLGVQIPHHLLNDILIDIEIADLVIWKDNLISIYTRENIYQIDLKSMELVDLKMIHPPYDHLNKSLFYQQMLNEDFSKKIGIHSDEAFQDYISLLICFYDKEHSDELKKAVNYLIGRGKGLTPSGDDILIGFLSCLKFLQRDEYVSTILNEVLDKTTAISQAYIKSLIHGYVNEDFKYFLSLHQSEDLNSIVKAKETVEKMGHTSGYDTLYGFQLGLSQIKKGESKWNKKRRV